MSSKNEIKKYMKEKHARTSPESLQLFLRKQEDYMRGLMDDAVERMRAAKRKMLFAEDIEKEAKEPACELVEG